MKKLSFVVGLLILSAGLTLKAQKSYEPGTGNGNGNGHYTHGNGNGYGHSKNHGVGAPLDGGLLLVLGGAGVAYYMSKKKNKKIES